MPPRFLERLEKQSTAYRQVFGDPQFDPPPYPFSRSASLTSSSSDNHIKALPSPPPPQYYSINQPTAIGFDAPALPRDSLILVTGANGWQGVHVVDQLLEHGFRVRGAVRNAEKAVWTSKLFKERYGAGRYTTAVIPDMVPQKAFDVAVRGCVGVVHCASVTTPSSDPTEVIPPTIAGALNALEAANKEKGVQRFVFCSSTAAAVSSGNGVRHEVTSDSWNMAAFKTAWQPPPYEVDRAWAVYAASKFQAEQAVWRWYQERKPHFVLNTVLPSMLWGKVLDPSNLKHSPSMGLLKLVFDGNAAATAYTPPQHFTDVQDAALLHVAALVLPDVRAQRIFAATAPYNINSLLGSLRELYPEQMFPGDVSDHGVDLSDFKETAKAEELLKRMGRKKGFTDLPTCLQRSCELFFK